MGDCGGPEGHQGWRWLLVVELKSWLAAAWVKQSSVTTGAYSAGGAGS